MKFRDLKHKKLVTTKMAENQEDAVFLLSRKDLVDRNLIKEKIIEHLGRAAWGLARHGYERWYDIADGRSRDEERDEAEGYIDS
jgi:hypothetical protein